MRKKILIFALLIPLFIQAQGIKNIGVLFDSLKTHPATTADQIRVDKALTGKRMVYSNLYPKIDLIGRYEYSSTASGMLPVAPNELLAMVRDTSVAQPFSENILRVGATISMPIYVASLFPMASKAGMMANSAQELQHINLLKNEATIVGANANLIYINSLEIALDKKRQSLNKTKEFVKIKVDNGRAPASALLNINNGINQVDILKNNLLIQKEKVITIIQSLTGIALVNPIEMTQTGDFQNGELLALTPLRLKTEALRLGYRSEKEKLLPALMLQGSYFNNTGVAYNNNKSVNNNYGTLRVILKIPIFEKTQYSHIIMSKLEYSESQNELANMQLQLSSQASQLEKSLILVNKSISLYGNSINDKQDLLDIAKVSYQDDRLSMEDYLKYEDDLLLEKSKLFKAKAEKWQDLMKLSVIYGNKIEDIVK